jgi:hypothetical protein
MNGYAVLFHKTCVHPCNTIHMHNALHYWRPLEYNVFGIGIAGVRMRSKITPFSLSYCPTDYSWRANRLSRTVFRNQFPPAAHPNLSKTHDGIPHNFTSGKGGTKLYMAINMYLHTSICPIRMQAYKKHMLNKTIDDEK